MDDMENLGQRLQLLLTLTTHVIDHCILIMIFQLLNHADK